MSGDLASWWLQDDFDVRVSVTEPRGHADLAAKSRDFMGKGAGAKALRALLRQWLRALVEHDGGQEKLAMDAVSAGVRGWAACACGVGWTRKWGAACGVGCVRCGVHPSHSTLTVLTAVLL